MAVPKTADIVIVGGGVIGASIAYHLARRGAGSGVVVLERERIGSGSTSASGGGIRSQFSTEVNMRFSLESVEFWRRFAEEMGSSVDYHEMGYLFLAQTADEREQMIRNVAFQNEFGVASRFLESDEAKQILPQLHVDDLSGATYYARDGQAGPNEATQAFARRARDGGVRIVEGVAVDAIEVHGGRIRSIETTEGRIEAPVVLDAAGPWAGVVGRMVGVDVPVQPYRRTIFISEPFTGLPERFPFVIDLHAGWAIKREGAGLYMTGTKDDHPSFDRTVDWDGLALVGEIATHRIPALAEARFGKKAYAGLYDVSPDNHAILGAVSEVEGFYVACGFSGHGFQHSPAVGRTMSELLLDGCASGIDIGPLGLDRFRTGSLLREPLNAHGGTMSG